MPTQSSPAGAAELTDRRSSAAERTSPAPSPNSIGSPSTSLCSTTSRSAPSTASTVPGSRICTPWCVRRGRCWPDDSTAMVTTSASSSTARSVVTIWISCSKMLALEPRDLRALVLHHEMLHVDDALAALHVGRRQHLQQLGMREEEIGVLAQIGDDLGGGDAARRERAARRVSGGRLILGPIQNAGPFYSAAALAWPRIDWPVFAQSARKAARPFSVSGWANICRSTAGGMVPTCAPSFAASTTCMGWRIEATSTSVLSVG